jgi:PAS domain S-box-containing protein
MAKHEKPSLPANSPEAVPHDPDFAAACSPLELELIRRLRDAEARAAFLNDLDRSVQPIAEPSEVMSTTARMLAEHLGADRCAYAEVTDESVFVITGDYARDVPSIVGSWPVAAFGPECVRQMLANESYVVTDTDEDDRIRPEDLPAYRATTIRAVICVPLHKDGKFTAAMAVHQKVPRVWTESEIDLVQTTVNRCWESLERIRAARVLRDSEETYRLLAETASDAIIQIDETSTIQFVNSAATRIFGYPTDELIGESILKIMPPELREDHRRGMARYLETGERSMTWTSVEVPALHKDGHRLTLEISFSESRKEDQRFFIGVARDITERRRTEDALRESEERYRGLFAAAPMAVFVCDTDAVIRHFNPIAAELWGREPVCGVERHCGSAKLWLPDGTWLPHDQSPMIEVLRTGIPVHNVEVFIERPDATRLPVLVNFAALKNDRGEITGAITSFIDITARKEAETALRESEEQLRTMADSIPQLAWMAEPDGSIFWYNQKWYEYTGTTPEQMEGWGWQSVHDPEILPQVLDRWTNSVKTGEPFSMEFPLRGADGSFRWFLTRVNALRNAAGEIVRWFGTNTDIQERREAEETLRQNQLLLSLAMKSSRMGVWERDVLGGTTWWSEELEAIFGLEKGSFAGTEQGFYDLIYNEDRAAVRSAVESALVAHRDYSVEFRFQHASGEIRWMEGRGQAVYSEDGEPIKLYGTGIDITERKELEASLHASEERFRALMEQAPLSIQLFDIEGRTTRVNRAWEELWGATLAQLGEYNILKDPQLEAAGIAPGIRRAFSGEAVELPAIRYDPNETLPGVSSNEDAVRWTSAVAYPLRSPDGELREVALVHQDITEKKRAEDRLEQQKTLLESLTESVLDGILIVVPRGEMLHYNQQFLDIWNFPPEILEGRSDDAALAWAADQTVDPAAFLDRVYHIYTEPDARVREEMRMKDGRVYERFGAPVNHGETRLGWVWTFRDITERKRMEEALERHGDELEATVRQRTRELSETNKGLKIENRKRKQLEAERLKLLSAITTVQEDERRRIALDLHDHLGQQLTALKFRIEILRLRGVDSGEFDRLAAEMHELVSRIDEEVDSLSWGLRPPSLDDIGLEASLADYVNEWSRRFEIPVNFTSAGFGKQRLLPETETHLYRITQEILTNVSKHAQATIVDIRLEKRERRVVLTALDDGVGFVPTNQRPAGGGGMGLIGMRERAAIMGGLLTVESEPNKGTMIIVDVPVSRAQTKK